MATQSHSTPLWCIKVMQHIGQKDSFILVDGRMDPSIHWYIITHSIMFSAWMMYDSDVWLTDKPPQKIVGWWNQPCDQRNNVYNIYAWHCTSSEIGWQWLFPMFNFQQNCWNLSIWLAGDAAPDSELFPFNFCSFLYFFSFLSSSCPTPVRNYCKGRSGAQYTLKLQKIFGQPKRS